MSPNPSLTTPQQKVLALIACGFTATAAAEQAGVHRNTVANWLRIDEFRSALVRAREEKEILYWDEAEALAAFGIANLRRLAVDTCVPAAVQLKATIALMDFARAYTPDTCAVVLPDLRTAPEISKTMHNDAQVAERSEDQPPAMPERSEGHSLAPDPRPLTPAANGRQKVGRNDLCPCGSGMKFKRCCLGKIKLDPHKPAAA